MTTIVQKLARRAVGAYAKLVMAAPPPRDDMALFSMDVRATRDLPGGLRRITFASPHFSDFARSGPDEYFGLLMPQPGAPLTLPTSGQVNLRAAVADMPEDVRPSLRWYSIRAHRPETGEIDVDIVTHGDSGPGSAWAVRAAPGDVAGFHSGGSLYTGGAAPGRHLFVADESALPALSAILESDEAPASPRHVHVELADAAALEAYPLPPDTVVHVREPGQAPGSVVIPAVEGAPLADLTYAWVCGESGLATGVRRALVHRHGMDRRAILFSGYWKLGSARI